MNSKIKQLDKMKKLYITPTSNTFRVEPMQMLASSPISADIIKDEDKAIDPSSAFSTGRSWSSDNWTADED